MGKLVVSLDGVVIKEVQVTKDRTTLGRRPYNDIVIDNLAVSGEHAVLQLVSGSVFIEDLNSTSGTFLNGVTVRGKLRVKPGQVLQVCDLTIDLQPESTENIGPGSRLADGVEAILKSGVAKRSKRRVPC